MIANKKRATTKQLAAIYLDCSKHSMLSESPLPSKRVTTQNIIAKIQSSFMFMIIFLPLFSFAFSLNLNYGFLVVKNFFKKCLMFLLDNIKLID